MNRKSKIVLLLLVGIMGLQMILAVPRVSSSSINASEVNGDWYDNRWHYKLYLQFNSTDYERNGYPIEYLLNLTDYLNESLTVDENSFRVFEDGILLPSEYHSVDNMAGTLIFVINGTTPVDTLRNYTVYFDVEENGLKPVEDYGEPEYVDNWEFIKGLGSSPQNGSNDNWSLPILDMILGDEDYDYSYVVGDVKAYVDAWGDCYTGSEWIRQYARATTYRDCFNTFISVWANVSDPQVMYGSGLVNISTGSPSGTGEDSLDDGLVVITDDWTYDDFATDITDSELMASSTIDIYDTGFLYNETVTFGYTSGIGNYALVSASENQPLEILQVRYTANDSILDPVEYPYSLDTGTSPREIILPTTLDDGVQLEVTFRRKLYGSTPDIDLLIVNASLASTEYLIMYDSDDPDEVAYDDPQIGALLFPEATELQDMVVEIWINVTDNLYGDYLLNISLNYNYWWYEPDSGDIHDEVDPEVDLVCSYLNGSDDPEGDVQKELDSVRNPTNVTLLFVENASPITLDLITPRNGDFFNGWMNIPTYDPLVEFIFINVSVGGDTVDTMYYQFGVGSEVEFTNEVDVPIADVTSTAFDGLINLTIIVVDTNGSRIVETINIIVVKDFGQYLFGRITWFFIMILSFFGVTGLLIISNIKRKRKLGKIGKSTKIGGDCELDGSCDI